MKLVIVESPAKAKTISRFLGSDYEVVASYGHVRDLPSSAAEVPKDIKSKPWARMAVDVENDFQPFYVVTTDSKKNIAALKKQVKDAEEVVLATDEDREGEAISWHLLEVLKPKVPVKRIVFHEITREAIEEAVRNPRQVDDQLVRAQESRRILDRLFGYSLSPVLWKKVRPKLSAGRVQSVAVRLVVEREEQRRAFNVAVYWDIEAALEADGIAFTAALVEVGGKRLATGKDFDANTGELSTQNVVWLDEDAAKRLAEAVTAHLPWRVARVDQKKARLRPAPPFITSTLQQAASSNLGFAPKRTMQVAQRLYEGVDLGGGEREGLITYMRTDSVSLSERALDEAAVVIRDAFGAEYHRGPRQYTTKSKLAQEAHEAIRPTHLDKTPDELARYLGQEELGLYRLVWNRTIASQMADAELLKTTVDITAETGESGEALFRTNGSVVTFPGFLRVADSQQRDTELPMLREGQQVGESADIALKAAAPGRHETKPPARYTEASLVRRLEEEGIGRPSTYAPTISIIQQRGYVELRGKALTPSFVGIAVTSLLRGHFADYVDLGFTARMEDALDNIADGKQDWVDFLTAFYRGRGQFGNGLEPQIAQEMEQIEFPATSLGEDSEGKPVIVRVGRSAPFIQRGEGGPGNTAPLPEGVTYEDLSIAKALDILETRNKGEATLGEDPETGMTIHRLIGPFGPYVQLGEVEKGKKPKRASLPKGVNPEDVDLETALRYLSLPRKLGDHPESGKVIRAGIGRFGPYIVHDGDFRSLEKTDDIFTVTIARALELLAKPKRTRGAKKPLRSLGKPPGGETEIQLYEGRYGPYVSDGSKNASLAKDQDPATLTLDDAVTLLANAPDKKKRPAKKKSAAKKKAPAKKKAAAKKKSAAKKKAPPS